MRSVGGVVLLAVFVAAPTPAAAQDWGAPATQPSHDLEAGGLAPPGSGEGAGDSWAGPTEPSPVPELSEADERDSGRGLEFFWINGGAGFEYMALQKEDRFADPSVLKRQQSGLVVDGALGVRLIYLTLGPRLRFARLSDGQLWTLDMEVGLHVPVGRLEPYASLAGGYAALRPRPDVLEDNIWGFDFRAGGGLDYYVSDVFSVGAAATAGVLSLHRPTSVDDAGTGADDGGTVGGSIWGASITASAILGLHF